MPTGTHSVCLERYESDWPSTPKSNPVVRERNGFLGREARVDRDNRVCRTSYADVFRVSRARRSAVNCRNATHSVVTGSPVPFGAGTPLSPCNVLLTVNNRCPRGRRNISERISRSSLFFSVQLIYGGTRRAPLPVVPP